MLAKEIPKPDFMEQPEWDLLMATRSPEIIRLGSQAHVKLYLESNGVDASRLESQGFGETKPIDTNRTPEGRARNRRVEFHIIQEDGS